VTDAAGETADVLEMVRWLAVRVPSQDLDEVLAYAKEVLPPGIGSYADHLAAICVAVDREPRAVKTIVEIARTPKEERQARLELTAWAKEALAPLQGRRPETSALRDLEHEARDRLHHMFPRASDPKVDGAVLVGVRLTEAGYAIDVGALVRCMFHHDPYERAG
jgi:hypothetical protein